MRVWTVFWLLVVAAFAVFAVANWQVLGAQTTINLIVTQVTAPLGLTMAGAIVGLALLFLLFLVWLETKTLIEMGRARRPTQDPAGPPVEELRADLERRFSALRTETSEAMRNVNARFDSLERMLKDEIERASQTLSSYSKRAS